MKLPKVIENSKLVDEVKSFIKSFQYKWTLLKGKVTCIVTGGCEWVEIKWNESIQFSLDFFKPIKTSEILAPIVGAIYAKYPEYIKPIQALLKELDKYPIPQGFIEQFKNQINNHLFEITYTNGELIISQSVPDTDNICRIKINEDLISEILKLATNSEDSQELTQNFILSILSPKLQEIIVNELKKEYEEISEYNVNEMLEEILGDKDNIDIENDYDSENDKFIIKVNNQKKYVIEVVNEHKALITVNSKPAFIVHTMTEIEEFFKSILEK